MGVSINEIAARYVRGQYFQINQEVAQEFYNDASLTDEVLPVPSVNCSVYASRWSENQTKAVAREQESIYNEHMCPETERMELQGQERLAQVKKMPYRDFRLLVSSCRDFAKDPNSECESDDEIANKLPMFYVEYIIISETFEHSKEYYATAKK